MKSPILYTFRRCPYAIRARMALAKAAISCEHREVSLKNKPEAMLAISSKGTVPVLELVNGEVIDESLDLMIWALRQNDPDKWLSVDLDEASQLIHENDFDFKTHLDHYKYHNKYPEFSQTHYRDKAEQYLSKLNLMLEKHRGQGLLATKTSLADVAIFPFIRQFAGVDREWFEQSHYHDLSKWLKSWENHEDFTSIMQKHDFWHSSN